MRIYYDAQIILQFESFIVLKFLFTLVLPHILTRIKLYKIRKKDKEIKARIYHKKNNKFKQENGKGKFIP